MRNSMKLTLIGHDDRYAVEQLMMSLFPDSAEGEATSTLHRLCQLEGNFWIYPGHGGSSTLRDEKKYNPYLR